MSKQTNRRKRGKGKAQETHIDTKTQMITDTKTKTKIQNQKPLYFRFYRPCAIQVKFSMLIFCMCI